MKAETGFGSPEDNHGDVNLISKAQIHEVVRQVNQREGLFNNEELGKLDGGYSVSDTEDNISGLNDMISAHSYKLHGVSPGGMRGSPSGFDENVEITGAENQMRQQQFSGALLGELASQKSKYNKRMQGLEKQTEQLRMEKAQLA